MCIPIDFRSNVSRKNLEFLDAATVRRRMLRIMTDSCTSTQQGPYYTF